MTFVIAFLSGILFSLGLTLSGMTQPHKVTGFLDVFNNWDVTLAFVMIGAITVHGISYFFIKFRSSPLLDTKFYIPKNKGINSKLILGASLFGVGWALAGLCPGPAIVSLASGSSNIVFFLLAMMAGSLLSSRVFK